MKLRAIIFILAGTLASMGGVAYAATATGEGGASISALAAIICSGLAQLGSTGILVKRYMTKVDADGAVIPGLVATLEAHKVAMEAHSKNMVELYGSRNAHELAIDRINHLHKLRKCEETIGKGACS